MDAFKRIGRSKMTNDQICKMLCNSEEFPYDSTDESSDDEIENTKLMSTKNKNVVLIDNDTDQEEESEISFDINASVHDSFIALMNGDNVLSSPIHSPVAARSNLAKSSTLPPPGVVQCYTSNSPAPNLRRSSFLQSPVARNGPLSNPTASSTPTSSRQLISAQLTHRTYHQVQRHLVYFPQNFKMYPSIQNLLHLKKL